MKVPVKDADVHEYARRVRAGEPLGQVFPGPMSQCEFTDEQRETIRLARADRRHATSVAKASPSPKTPAQKPPVANGLKKLSRLLYLQSGRCFFCGESVEPAQASIEHLNPQSRGGSRTEDNEVVCHKTLNHALGNLDLKSKFAFVLKSAGSFQCPKS